MPQRATSLQTSFDVPPPEVTQPKPPVGNGFFDAINMARVALAPMDPVGAAEALQNPRTRDTLSAAFQLDNDVVNGIQLLSRPSYTDDPSFDVEGALKKDGYWNNYKDNFVGVHSQTEYNDVTGRITSENRAKGILAGAGFSGQIAAMAAGLVSPTLLLPFAGEARGVKAVADAALLGAAAGAIHEEPLALNQEAYNPNDFIGSVAMSTVLGGVLGGAASFLKRPIEDVAKDMVTSRGEAAIQPYANIGTQGESPVYYPSESYTIEAYHGSSREFKNFDPTFQGSNTGLQSTQGAFFFGGPKTAEAFSKGKLDDLEVEPDDPQFLNSIKNKATPAEFADAQKLVAQLPNTYVQLYNKAQNILEGNRPNVRKVRLRLENPLVVDMQGHFSPQAEFDAITQAKTAGNDGVVINNWNPNPEGEQHPIYAVFDRNQIWDGVGSTPTKAASLSAAAAAVHPDVSLQTAPIGFEHVPGTTTKLPLSIDQTTELASQLAGPATQTISQRVSAKGRWLMAQVADVGLRFKGNKDFIPASPGGTVESNVRLYDTLMAQALQVHDDAYARYFFSKTRASTFLERQRAALGGNLPFRTKMSPSEFSEQVSYAMETGDQHAVPEVAEVAQHFRKNIVDPLYEEAQRLGIFSQKVEGEPEVLGAATYWRRDWDQQEVKARQPQFEAMVADHFNQKLQKQYQEGLGKLTARTEKVNQRVTDFGLRPEEVQKVKDEVTGRLKQIDEGMTPEEKDLEDYISAANELAADRSQPAQVRADAREQAQILGANNPARDVRRAEVRALKSRVRSFNKSRIVMETNRLKKLMKVDRTEELSLNSLNRAVRTGQKFLAEMDKLSDDKLNARISDIRNQFEKVAGQYDRGEERISQLRKDETDAGAGALLFGEEFRQGDRADRLDQISQALDSAETLDRGQARALVQEGLDEVLSKVNSLNGRRAVRASRLEEAALKISPERVQKEIDDLKAGQAAREGEFSRAQEALGAEMKGATGADFTDHAKDIAHDVAEKILGTYVRLSGVDLLMEPKGAEIARALDIPTDKAWEWLNHDSNNLMQQYVHTLAPDIELTRKLGSFAQDADRNEHFKELTREKVALQTANEAEMRSKGKSDDEVKKANLKISGEYDKIFRNLEAVIGRLRGTYGLARDPTALSERLGRIALNLNVLRFMNVNVVNSSLSDIGQPIWKYGLLHTFRKGFVPFVQGVMKGEFSARELKLAGATLDLVLHSRAHAFNDINDFMVKGTRFEKALQYASSKAGVLGMFDIWTTAMKEISGTAINAQLVDDVRSVMEGAKGKDLAKAYQRLSEANLDADTTALIHKELSAPGGSDIVNGVMWPNTAAWKNPAAVRAYRTAINKSVRDVIITPGVGDKPKWVDRMGIMGRILYQFHSFAGSSVSKTFLAGLQKHDTQVLYGWLISLALGTASYYISSKLKGGNTEANMQAALEKGDWGHFADEGINRSGIFGSFNDIQNLLSTIPAVGSAMHIGAAPPSRVAGDSMIDYLGGPTEDLVKRSANVLQGVSAGHPTRSTAHNASLLVPFQSNYALRRLLDQIEKGFPAQ